MDLSIVGKETWALSRPCPPGMPGCSSTVFLRPLTVDLGTLCMEPPSFSTRTSNSFALLLTMRFWQLKLGMEPFTPRRTVGRRG